MSRPYRLSRLAWIALAAALGTLMCTSGYITPDSLTATALATPPQTIVPTAFFLLPTDTATLPPTQTSTPDPALASPTLEVSDTPLASDTPATGPLDASAPPLTYYAQAGDSLLALARRFGANPFEIVSPEAIPEQGFINPGQLMLIPRRLGGTAPAVPILPDSEVVYSPSAIEFDVITYVNTIGGHLSGYREYLGSTGWLTGAQIVQRVAVENSINPRVLLSLLEYQSHWVLGQPTNLAESDYPMGYVNENSKGLFAQLSWAVDQLSVGYYGWRAGTLTDLEFSDSSNARLAPELNAGSVAVQYFFSKAVKKNIWAQAIDPAAGLANLHTIMFSDPWARASQVEPLFPANLEQPELILPFLIGQRWAYTGGPHGAWSQAGSQAALDFAPGSVEHGCVQSDLWAVAAAAGVVIRSGNGVLVLDLDGDGNEQTGWVLLYLHIRLPKAFAKGTWVDKSELLGHPSCDGGSSTGTHLHLARKYNGEWVAADGPVPFVLSGWRAYAGLAPYLGMLTRDGETITACTCGSAATNIMREQENP